jgi:SAM-dependent methyltransferase
VGERAEIRRRRHGAGPRVFSRFGVMFFADPDRAFAHLRRALAPRGRIAFACWLAENPWARRATEAASAALGPPPPSGGRWTRSRPRCAGTWARPVACSAARSGS